MESAMQEEPRSPSISQICDPAIMPLEGLNLIEASAGTGKTFTITALALRMIVERGLSIDQLLIVTFTKAATAELKQRIFKRLAQAQAVLDGQPAPDPLLGKLAQNWQAEPGATVASKRIREARGSFDRAAVFTIHGWCQRLLQDQSLARGDLSALDLRPDHGEWLDAFVQDYWTRMLYDAPPIVADILYAQGGRFGPSALLEVGTLVLRDPELVVQGVLDWSHCLAVVQRQAQAWEHLREQVALVWNKDSEGVRAYYQSIHPKLNQNTHRKKSYERRLEAVWQWIHGYSPTRVSEDLLKAFAGLSYRGLMGKGGVKAKQQIDVHPAAQALDPCSQAWEELSEQQEELSRALVQDFVQVLKAKAGLHASGGCTFDELLLRVRDLLRDPARKDAVIAQTRDTYRAALIDEFQDTDPAQYEIVSTFWGTGHGTLFLVGDPKQAIYRFRGADIHAYLNARNDAAGHRYRLTHNYRSHAGVIHAVNALFSGIAHPFAIPQLGFEPVEVGKKDKVQVVQSAEFAPRALSFWVQEEKTSSGMSWEIQALVQRVRAYLTQGQWSEEGQAVRAGDLAVLCRSNHQATMVRDAFEAQGLASVLRAGQSVWRTQQVDELLIVLRAVLYPGRREGVRAALLTEAFGLNLDALQDLQRDDAAWERWSARFFDWRSIWQERGVLAMWRDLCGSAQVARNLLRGRGKIRSLTNWEQLIELVYLLEREHRCTPQRLLRLIAARRQSDQGPDELDAVRAAEERESIQILTIHKSKGLEFSVVFCPDLRQSKERSLPTTWIQNAQGERSLQVTGAHQEDAKALYREEEASESRRLLYVALTRAKSHCEVFWPERRADASALGALLKQHDLEGRDPLGGMQALAAVHPNEIACAPLSIEAGASRVVDTEKSSDDTISQPRPAAPSAWQRRWGPRVSSYSALAKRMARDGEMGGAVGDDPLPGQDEAQGDVRGTEPEPLRFSQLTPGAHSGVFLHELFEVALARGVDASKRVSAIMERASQEANLQDSDTLVEEICEVLELPVDRGSGPFTLAQLDEHERAVEVEFLFRCGAFGGCSSLGGQAQPVPFEAAALADAIKAHSQDARLVAYAARLRQRGFGELHGFLNGFIDLVFQRQGRYFVADYKSNILDAKRSDFQPENLWAYAAEKDYVLQALIYGVALHRRLRQCVPDYRPQDLLGEALLLFVRGMDEHGAGVLGVPLESEVILAVDEAMQRGFDGREEAQ